MALINQEGYSGQNLFIEYLKSKDNNLHMAISR